MNTLILTSYFLYNAGRHVERSTHSHYMSIADGCPHVSASLQEKKKEVIDRDAEGGAVDMLSGMKRVASSSPTD